MSLQLFSSIRIVKIKIEENMPSMINKYVAGS